MGHLISRTTVSSSTKNDKRNGNFTCTYISKSLNALQDRTLVKNKHAMFTNGLILVSYLQEGFSN
jgi:hypothetical protein